jgi:hypothetical protein
MPDNELLVNESFQQIKMTDDASAIIEPDPKVCLPVYLSLFLNSPAGLAQSEMFQTGSSGQLEIYPQHIRAILVYLPHTKSGKVDLACQQEFADKILAAAQAKIEARAKLEEAKRLLRKKAGIVEILWCGNAECGHKLEEEVNARVLGTPIDLEETVAGNCVVCGKKAKTGSAIDCARHMFGTGDKPHRAWVEAQGLSFIDLLIEQAAGHPAADTEEEA